ncbi:hypothetical protein [Sulfobacillus sp. hq2]|uniref:hypothetical protein n=1 Tax=Sulfobacillus TaxID=28033 RepID=UPI000CD03983|nr:hypothetical protein [Sulfobacillus sp. hq2]POB10542.1 hypothetical protein CO251_09540 [Sulfobacillus sp. hq2]
MGTLTHSSSSSHILRHVDSIRFLRIILQETCSYGTVLTLWVGRFQRVPWYITRHHWAIPSLNDSATVPVSCLTASKDIRWAKHLGTSLSLPWTALKLAIEVARHPYLLLTREVVNRSLKPTEQWSPSAWQTAVHDLQKSLPAHFHRVRGLGYTFQSCMALPSLPMTPIQRFSGASLPLGWVKRPNDLTWTVLLSVHHALDLIPTAEVLIFNLIAWTDDRDWLDALLEQAWLSTAHVWLWDERRYELSRTQHDLSAESIEQLHCLEIDWIRHQMWHRGQLIGLPWRGVQLLA